jgi:hypothetical protein
MRGAKNLKYSPAVCRWCPVGIGAVPDAVLAALTGCRGLAVRS